MTTLSLLEVFINLYNSIFVEYLHPTPNKNLVSTSSTPPPIHNGCHPFPPYIAPLPLAPSDTITKPFSESYQRRGVVSLEWFQ